MMKLLPSKEEFYSSLSMKDIKDVQSDILLFPEAFENFRKKMY